MVPLAAWRQSHGEQGGEVNESTRIFEESRENLGAAVMGRNMLMVRPPSDRALPDTECPPQRTDSMRP